MNSHEYAREVIKTAERLLAKPVLEWESNPLLFVHFYDKDKFVEAVKAVGSGKKDFTSYDDVHYMPNGTCLTFSIPRNKVCRKVQDVKWECEPFFTDSELPEVGVATDDAMPF